MSRFTDLFTPNPEPVAAPVPAPAPAPKAVKAVKTVAPKPPATKFDGKGVG